MTDYTMASNEELAGALAGTDINAVLKFRDRDALNDEIAKRLLGSHQKINTSESLHETAGCLIEIFEAFLDEKGIDIPNDDKKDDPGATTIYGCDYGDLETVIEGFLVEAGFSLEVRDV